MAGEGEGEVHNFNCEQPRVGGGRGGNKGGGRGRGGGRGNLDPFGFPIPDEDKKTIMKNISPSILQKFLGLRSEDPRTFLFEFEVLCRSSDYLLDPQKLKLFPATLKDATLKRFMVLGAHSKRTWEEMKTTFLKKYKDYCMPHNIKDEVFKTIHKEDENLEYFNEKFAHKRAKMHELGDETLKTLLL